MAGNSNKPVRQQSQSPKKGAGSSGFRLEQNGNAGLDPLAQRVLMATHQSMSGPLPHGAEFASYEQTLPGAASRILAMAEREQEARLLENKEKIRLDEKLITGYKWRTGFGQFAVLALVSGAFWLSYLEVAAGHDAAGIAVSTTAVAAVLVAFLRTKSGQPTPEPTEEA